MFLPENCKRLVYCFPLGVSGEGHPSPISQPARAGYVVVKPLFYQEPNTIWAIVNPPNPTTRGVIAMSISSIFVIVFIVFEFMKVIKSVSTFWYHQYKHSLVYGMDIRLSGHPS